MTPSQEGLDESGCYGGAPAPASGARVGGGGGLAGPFGGGGGRGVVVIAVPALRVQVPRVPDRRVKRVWDLAVSGRETVLLWRRRRWRCEGCGKRHLEDHPGFEGKVTRRLARRLVGDVAVMPISAAARRAGVSWHLVNDLVRA